MNCKLCNEEIKNYSPSFHHLKLEEYNSVDICSDCSDKFLKWQTSVIANLFPTKVLKKRNERNKKV